MPVTAVRPGANVAYIEDWLRPWTVFDADGVPSAGAPDHSPALQALADNLGAVGGGVISSRGSTGAIVLGATVVLPMGVSIDMPSVRKRLAISVAPTVLDWNSALRFVPRPSGVFLAADGSNVSVAAQGSCVAGYLFFGNVSPGSPPTPQAIGIPDIGVGCIRNLYVDGFATNGISILYCSGAYELENWRGDYVATAVRKLSSQYTDKFKCKRFNFFVRPNNTSYLIDARGTGDGLEIDVIESGYFGTSPALGVTLSDCRGGAVTRLINGVHQFSGSIAVTIANCHIENGGLILDRFQGSVRDNDLHNGAGNYTPITIQNSSSSTNGSSYSTLLSGNRFLHYVNAGGVGSSGWSTTDILDVVVGVGGSRGDVVDDGTNRRVVGVSGQLDVTAIVAPRIGTMSGATPVPYPDLLKYGPMLQTRPLRLSNGSVEVSGVLLGAGAWTGVSASLFTPVSGVTVAFKGASATYYYNAQIILCPDRKVGRGATGSPPAVSVAAVNGANQLPRVEFDYGTMRREGGFLVRVYRGLADGAFTQYVDVPAIALKYGFDDGMCFASFPWITRPSGAMDAVNAAFTGTMIFEDGIVQARNSASATPTTGIWKKGDRTFLDSPAADANSMVLEGSSCTVAGAPGTWVNRRYSTVSPAV